MAFSTGASSRQKTGVKLKPFRITYDRVIVRLLVSTKFRIEKVKDKIDALISTKHKTPEFLFNRDPLSPIIDEYLRYGFFAVLPKKTPDNHRISFFRIKSPREFVVIEVIKIALMTLEYRRYNDVCLGDQYVYDLSNVRFSNTVQMTPPIVTKMVYYVLYCSGSKIKGIHLINMPAFAVPILGLIKKLLKPKIAARIHIHSKPEDIANVFPKSILPKECGGDELSFEEVAVISTKHKTPEFLFNRDPLSPIIDEYLRYGFFAILPKKTPDNHRVSFFRIKSPREFVVIELIKIALMTFEYRRYNDACLGDEFVYDLNNVSFSNTVQMTPPIVTKMMYYILYCSGSKIKGIHFINMPAFAIPILGLIKKLLKPKIAARIHIHSKPEDIANVFPKSILPKEYGGDEFSYEEIAEEWRKTVQSDVWRQYFIDQDKVISDESKRTRALSCNEVFGCDGSFRKLEFD
ncbi:Alpha-tocopherol transfer protein [Papilio machaon]|uniref:Alpha-tocopherol transfer protein n=1 Tax=Papilio machaon TaxID=76193 RepID=A0A194R2W5_PAPMA|nr:Alpha-tocopherol transfer protein [Papilio machaon]